MLKKCFAVLLSLSLAAGTAMTGMLAVGAAAPTEITPFPYTHTYGQATKMMFPGNVFWGDMIRVPGWGIPVEDPDSEEAVNPGYRDSQHRISQFMSPDFVTGVSDPMSSIRYTPLDVKLIDGKDVLVQDPTYVPYEGFYNESDPDYYREGKFFGTFLGVRQDYAVFPAVPTRGLKEFFLVKPGSYVATSLLFNSYTLNFNGGSYAAMDQGWQFLSSADGQNWEPLEVEYDWENSPKGSPIYYEKNNYWCFHSVTASMKMPEEHMYYAVVSPADEGLAGARPLDTFAIGATKVSSTPMDNGAYGDEYVDVYGATSKQPLAVNIDHLHAKVEVFADFDVKLDQVTPLIEGNVKFFKEDGTTEVLDTESMSLAKKMGCYTKAGEKKLEYTVEVKPTGKTTIGPNDSKKALYPGVVDRLVSSYNYSGNPHKIYYNDYAELTGDISINLVNLTDEFMGKPITTTYFSTTGTGENDTIKYSILPSTHIATGLLVYYDAVCKEGTTNIIDEAKVKAVGKSLTYETSRDGINWTQIDMDDSNFHLENTADGAEHTGYVVLKASFQAPDDAYYYRITMDFSEVPSLYHLYIGPTKASKTDMSGDKTGDEEVAWYEMPDVTSNSTSLLINKGDKTITVSSIEEVALQDVLSMLKLTKLEYQFQNADGDPITDLSTKLQSQMKVVFTVADSGDAFGAYTLIFEQLEEEKEPGIESKDSSIVEIDEINKKVVVKKTGLTLQDILDNLTLNGGVDVFFSDENEEMIDDLTISVKSGQTLEVYTDLLLAVYTIEAAEEVVVPEPPVTSAGTSFVLLLAPFFLFAVLLIFRKRIKD